MAEKLELSRQTFGNLVVIQRANKQHGRTAWLCRCMCGNTKIVTTQSLRNGKIVACGCTKRARIIAQSTTHGLSKSREYEIWSGMLKRCNNPRCINYKNYGGRGITVCLRWLSFSNFYADMGTCPVGFAIDRINNNEGYFPDNCRWADRKTNNRNTRHNRLVTHNNKTQCLSAWAEELNIKRTTLAGRLRRGAPLVVTTHACQVTET